MLGFLASIIKPPQREGFLYSKKEGENTSLVIREGSILTGHRQVVTRR